MFTSIVIAAPVNNFRIGQLLYFYVLLVQVKVQAVEVPGTFGILRPVVVIVSDQM